MRRIVAFGLCVAFGLSLMVGCDSGPKDKMATDPVKMPRDHKPKLVGGGGDKEAPKDKEDGGKGTAQ